MSMQHQPRPIVPIRYSGYRTCCQCGYKFYSDQPAHRDVTCRLCRVEQTWQSVSEPLREEPPAERVETPPSPQSRLCGQCGASYTPHPKASNSRYCSATCRLEHRRAVNVSVCDAPKIFRPRTCTDCGTTYTPTGTTQRVCAPCKKDARREYHAAYKRAQRRKAAT